MYIDELDVVSLAYPYKDGKQSKKLEVESHVNSKKGSQLKSLIPLLEEYSESLGTYNSKIKLTVEFIEGKENE